MSSEKIRVLVAKVGLDGHDRGARVIARFLRDSGMDVIYTGLHRTPEEVVVAASQEDVDIVGVSLLSGAHMTIIPRLIQLMRAEGLNDTIVVAGGVIPDEDVPRLLEMGIARIFTQETALGSIAEDLRRLVAERGLR